MFKKHKGKFGVLLNGLLSWLSVMPNMFINLQEWYVYDQNFHGGRDGGCVVGNFAALLLSFYATVLLIMWS